ncbi:heat shock factor protein 5-like [Oncorhynchus mykiss]|uniref:heat shock factor protein 5-like n=1 Tax=Oncorhynchus mykiss TaxID=8022 RepID=UPI00187895C8|nr:heat shock factor protein 5-like [Oncorhynchus mykiss]
MIGPPSHPAAVSWVMGMSPPLRPSTQTRESPYPSSTPSLQTLPALCSPVQLLHTSSRVHKAWQTLGPSSTPSSLTMLVFIPLVQCSMDSNCHSVHQTTPSYSHYSYYQPTCPVGFLYHGNQNQDWQSRENKETKKSEVNLDTVFQIVDELHHSSPKIRMVKL